MQFRILLVLAILMSVFGAVSAQDDDEQNEGGDLYDAFVPTTRGEDGAFILGDPEAPVTVIEFADYLCPFCQEYHADTINPFIENYVLTGQAKFEYRFFPIIDQNISPLMSIITECAYEQDAFWRVHDELYTMAREDAISETLVGDIVERADLDAELLDECLSGEGPFQFQEDQALGSDLSVSGTPAVRVRVGDADAGYLLVEGVPYNRGGPGLDLLANFVEAETPSDLVQIPNQLLDDTLLEDNSLIETEDDCGPPCWNGITPGETTFDEAVTILEELDSVAEVQAIEDSGQRVAIFGGPENVQCCQMLSQDGESIAFLQLRTAPTLTIGEIIEAYEEPDYLDGAPFTRSQTIFNLYYVDESLVVFIYADAGASLTEESQVIGSVYIDPALYDDIIANSFLHEWEGYMSLEEYNEGEFELSPE